MGDVPFGDIHYGRERCDAGDLPRHRHVTGYLTLVLRGGYLEAGDAGRFRVGEGDVLIHRPFEAHRDLFAAGAAEVLNLPLPHSFPKTPMIRIDDPDAIVRLAATHPHEAAEHVCSAPGSEPAAEDWPDLLAQALRRPRPIGVGEWARRHGLAPATVSRGFGQVYGTTPARYRAEARTRLAIERLRSSAQPMIEVALDLGFSDQAHMTRSVQALTGFPSVCWRLEGQKASRR